MRSQDEMPTEEINAEMEQNSHGVPPVPSVSVPTVSSRQFQPGWGMPIEQKGYLPGAQGQYFIWRDRDMLVMTSGSIPPGVCPFTNEIENLKLKPMTFKWLSPDRLAIVIVGLLVALLLGAILASILTKEMKIQLPLGPTARRRRLLGSFMNILGVIMFFFGFLCVLVMAFEAPVWVTLITAAFVSGIVFTLGWFGSRWSRLFRVKRIHQDFVWIKGVAPDYLASFPPLPEMYRV